MTRVWAPAASSVVCHVRAADARPEDAAVLVPMAKASDGWWEAPALPPGTDYAFDVDGSGPLPDPRSAWQPHGVHGFSRVFDTTAFAWTDTDWQGLDARGVVTYELHVGTFTAQGTLDAIIGRQLKDLARRGIQMIELMPVAAFPGTRGWGYDGVALYAVHDAYGGPAALQRFVDAAHREGLGVCLDVVYNHLGPEGNYLPQFGPYFTGAHHTPWGWAVNLDQEDSEGARAFIVDNALRWFEEFHIDALRLDAVHEFIDESPTHILAELAARTRDLEATLGRPLSLVAENAFNQLRTVTPLGEVTPEGERGLGMTAQWADDVHHALHSYLTGERHLYYEGFGTIVELQHAFTHVYVRGQDVHPSHDRAHDGPMRADVDRRRFVVCATNHDQVGNRPLGDRPSSVLPPGAHAASLALVLLSPFTPLLFMGEEYGETRPFLFFTDLDPELGPAIVEGREAEFGSSGWEDVYGGPFHMPDPQDKQTFLRSKLGSGVGAAAATHRAIETWFDQVMRARPLTLVEGAWKRHPLAVTEEGPRQLTMHGPVLVHANLSGEPMNVTGAPLATFGRVEIHPDSMTLHPDAVVLVAGEEA